MRRFLVGAVALGCFAPSQTTQGQDEGELNFNTAEGDLALHTYITNATPAAYNTAIDLSSLWC